MLALQTMVLGWRKGLVLFITERMLWLGMTVTTSWASWTTLARSLLTVTVAGSSISGR